MPRRWTDRSPNFGPLVLAVMVGLFALTTHLTAQPPTEPANPIPDIKKGEEKDLETYRQLTIELRRLAQKWKNSPDAADKARAAIIEEALNKAEEKGVDTLFKDVIGGLGGNPTGSELSNLIQNDRRLNVALLEVLEILKSDDALTKIKKDIDETKKLIEEVKQLKAEQENLEALTNRPMSDAAKLAKTQAELAKKTQQLADKMAGKKSDGKPSGDPQDKGDEPKAGEKPGENSAEAKPDSQKDKPDAKDPMGGDPKDGEAKPMDGKPDAGMTKETPKMGDPMAGDPKSAGEPKSGDPMMGEPKPPMQGDSKPQGDPKGDQKPSDSKSGGDAKPMDSPMSPMSPSDSQGSSKSSPSSPSSPSPSKPQDDQAKAKAKAQENVQKAVPNQKGAENDLNKNDKDSAKPKENKAAEELAKALEELEKRLKQLRDKELAKKLEDLEQRIEAMLKKQRAVRVATGTIDAGILKKGGMADTADKQKSQVQANNENDIVVDAQKALELLADEGSAVVFAGVLDEVKKDMESIRDRLNKGNVGEDTQLIEDQTIEQLERMLAAVKKAKKDLESPPPPPSEGGPPPGEQDKELIELVAQLKLLRELQVIVNNRTMVFGKKANGPQATDLDLQNDLKKLGERQKALQEMLHKIATKAIK